ncbi:MAG TPA: selenocysteine-specific translation elongation factor, partial [Acidobacteriota bacterium]|nr:selenocysteine-specific translation elongation factor [Acidobacteriota bacterium]
MYVMGTAGHVDHGKSTLVIALSGIDPDRLPEEKARGMTIDLGFAWMTTDSGETIGIIDVPGHERLVKNMIAGVGALDFVLLIVAADDGWMPQSAEHLAILRFLGVARGIVVITKIDGVDPDWLELVRSDVTEQVRGSFLEDAPIIAVDSVSHTGLDELRAAIDTVTQSLTPRRDIGSPRLYIDRVFTIAGRGAVVTGTLIDGSLSVGRPIAIEPGGISGRVRDLQVHKQHVEQAAPGQRVAVNFSGVDLAQLSRGQCVVAEGGVETVDRLWVDVSIWSDAVQPLRPGRQVLVMLGTSEPEATAYPVGAAAIASGHNGLCELRLKEPIVARLKDRFVLRWPTPQVTIGGGEVIDLGGTRRSHRDAHFIASLRGRIAGDLPAYRRSELTKNGFAPRVSFLNNGPWSADAIASDLTAGI